MLTYVSRFSLTLKSLRDSPGKTTKLLRWVGHGSVQAGKFLKTCLIDGTQALIAGKYDRRQAALIIAGNLTTIIGALFITVPGLLFPEPTHNTFYYFADILCNDSTSLIPMGLGAISSTLGLRVPLG